MRIVPFVESILFGVALETSLFDEEFHPLVEGSRYGWRLFAQQDVDRLRGRHAERRFLAVAGGAAIRVLAVHQAVLVVVLAVFAFHFQRDAAVRPFPALVATTTPSGASFRRLALASFGAVARAAFQRAVFPVPARDAEASAVLALAVLVASRVAETLLAEFAGPSRIADAGAGLAASVSAAVDAASRFGTIVASPAGRANAFVQLQTEGALAAGTIGQTLHGVAVDRRAIRTLPTFLADASAVDAEAVFGASRMRAIHCFITIR